MRRKYRKVKIITLLLLMTLTGTVLTGCQGKSDTKVVLTAGFGRDEIFRIEDMSCRVPEIMVYLTNIQNHYETIYGSTIWNTKIDDKTLEENVKETALAQIAQIKAMTLLAKKHDVTLNENEEELVKKAAAQYYQSLNQKEIETMGVDEDTIVSLYQEYALSDKLYHFLIKDINPEISDDEARTITVEHILLKTYSLDENGEKIEYTEYAKEQTKKKAEEICIMAKNGDNFDDLAAKYSEDDTLIYSFGKGEMEEEFENAAFNLGTDEISSVVETPFGYHIIKCISTFNKEVTDENKKKIVEKRKEEVFGDEYDTFVKGLTKNLNQTLWNSITFIHDDEVTTSDFFEVYDSYFKES